MIERKGVLALILLLLCWFTYAALISEAPAEGGADNYQHFQIARWAFTYPHLFLDHWGKPFFTLLISPFAQFGFAGAKIFNVLMGIFAAWLTFLTSKKLQLKNSWLVIIFLCFMPMFFSMMNSTMTEILCSTLLIGSVFLFYNSNYYWCAVLASFLPFVRTEVFLLVPFFALALLFKKQFKAIPLLLTGFILYSLIGWFYYHDLLWVFNRNPYTSGASVYGHGGPFDFLKANKAIWGIPINILFITGLAQFVFFSAKAKGREWYFELFLVILPAFAHLAAHSYVWWKGIGASLGLIRVITPVLPLYAIMALRGFNFVKMLPVFTKKSLSYFLFVITLIVIIHIPFRNKAIVPPVTYDETDKMVERACSWLKENKMDKNKIYFINPLIPIFLDKCQFDENQMQFYFNHVAGTNDSVPENGLIIWDAHFANNEGNLKLQTLLDDGRYVIKKVINPSVPLRLALGNYEHKVIVLQKNNARHVVQPILISLDFEVLTKLIDDSSISIEEHFSQNHSYKLTSQNQFSPTLSYSLQKIKRAGYDSLFISVNVLCKENLTKNASSLVVSFDRNQTPFSYNKTDIETNGKASEWTELSLAIAIPDSIQDSDTLKVYVWQRNGEGFMDDFEVSLK